VAFSLSVQKDNLWSGCPLIKSDQEVFAFGFESGDRYVQHLYAAKTMLDDWQIRVVGHPWVEVIELSIGCSIASRVDSEITGIASICFYTKHMRNHANCGQQYPTVIAVLQCMYIP
jgi:hypothetical protein